MKYFIQPIVLVLILFASVNPLFAQKQLEIQVTNYTGKRIAYMYVAIHQSDSYSNESILKGFLNDGLDMVVQLPNTYGKQCMFDLKTVYADGTDFIWDQLDFCNNHFFTFQPRGFINIR